MADFQLPAMARFTHELRMLPARLRPRQLDAIERLIGLLDPARDVPLELIRFHITGRRDRKAAAAEMLPGAEALADLVVMGEQLSLAAPLNIEDLAEPYHAIEDLQSRFHVSSRTLQRWKARGLCGRWFLVDGAPRYAITDSALRRFAAQHVELIGRAARFQVLSTTEREHIVRRAEALRQAGASSLHSITKTLASETGRAIETIRLLLRRESFRPVGTTLAAPAAGPEAEVWAAHRAGESVAELSARLGYGRAEVESLVRRGRAADLAHRQIGFIDCPLYGDDAACQQIMAAPGDLPVEETFRERPDARTPPNLPAELAALYRTPLLTPAGERRLFHQYNLLKRRAAGFVALLRPATATDAEIERIDSLLARAASVRQEIVQANLRLVVSVARRHLRSGSGPSMADLVSEGNLALLRAVEKFDVSRGFRFSTYATWAITRLFAHVIPDELGWQTRHRALPEAPIDRSAGPEAATGLDDDDRSRLRRALSSLDQRERVVMERLFGFDGQETGETLEEIGRSLGVSKERARQLKDRALVKLRSTLA